MSINRSIIEGQNEDVTQILAPNGFTLLSAPSLTPVKSAIGYDLTTNQICYANGTDWIPSSSGTGSALNVQAPLTATDDNGLIVNNGVIPSVIFLEFADETHPGILRAPVIGSADMTLGADTTANAINFTLRKIGTEVSGCIDWVGLPCNDTNPGIIVSSVFIPANMRPAATKQFICSVLQNTTITWGECTVDTNGRVIITYNGLQDFPANQNARCFVVPLNYLVAA